MYWTGYEYLKARAVQKFNQHETNFFISFMCGAVAGSVAAFITTPFDVVKTHRQITLGEVISLSILFLAILFIRKYVVKSGLCDCS